MKPIIHFTLLTLFLASPQLGANKLMTNEFHVPNAPEWLKRTRIEKVTDRIQKDLEWRVRRIYMHWYKEQADFEKAHSLGSQAIAVTTNRNGQLSVHMGPKINDKNFDEVFAHELVHVIVAQKYKSAIPKWFEEGLANHLAQASKVNYKWLVKQDLPKDVRDLAHPLKERPSAALSRYKAAQALAEMLDKKCDLENLIRLSVERKMEDYIKTYCEIKDLNGTFQKWVKDQAAAK